MISIISKDNDLTFSHKIMNLYIEHVLYCKLLLSFADYLCSDLINKEELSTSCKENEDPDETVLKAPKNMAVPQPNLSDNNKNTKNTKPEDDAFEDDDDVFQQYMPQNVDTASTAASIPPKTNTSEQKQGRV